uniref:SJCHGC06553 protein n=1 Tax=Schistosoma japonicum TaxID=6182 RepID=Q5DFS9_SCHJA|nr:SJCHGC06553 protein [Schistosoma japonicum]
MLPYFDYQFRVIIIGDSMVGKSSLMKSFVEGNFSPVSDPTIGVDFFSRTVRIQEEVFVKLQLWDTAGQEKFRSITPSYYRNWVGVIMGLILPMERHSTIILNGMKQHGSHISALLGGSKKLEQKTYIPWPKKQLT